MVRARRLHFPRASRATRRSASALPLLLADFPKLYIAFLLACSRILPFWHETMDHLCPRIATEPSLCWKRTDANNLYCGTFTGVRPNLIPTFGTEPCSQGSPSIHWSGRSAVGYAVELSPRGKSVNPRIAVIYQLFVFGENPECSSSLGCGGI